MHPLKKASYAGTLNDGISEASFFLQDRLEHNYKDRDAKHLFHPADVTKPVADSEYLRRECVRLTDVVKSCLTSDLSLAEYMLLKSDSDVAGQFEIFMQLSALNMVIHSRSKLSNYEKL